MNQETIALLIVGIAAMLAGESVFRKSLAEPLARFFLRQGKVKLAMRLKAQSKSSACGKCGEN